jgi:hypothetical protein
LLGYSATASLVKDVKALALAKLQNARIVKLVANRFAGTFSEVDV